MTRGIDYPKLDSAWCHVEHAPGVDTSRPGIYKWTIEGVGEGIGEYVGKYTRFTRPTREYKRNVERLMAGLCYRRGKPDGYRRVHRELERAVREDRRITLTILENPAPTELNLRERELIQQFGSLNEPPFGDRSLSQRRAPRRSARATPCEEAARLTADTGANAQ